MYAGLRVSLGLSVWRGVCPVQALGPAWIQCVCD